MVLFPVMLTKAVCIKSVKWVMKECYLNAYWISGNMGMWMVTQFLHKNWDKIFHGKIFNDSNFMEIMTSSLLCVPHTILPYCIRI